MGVDVDEARRDGTAGRVELALTPEGGSDLADDAVGDRDVGDASGPAGGQTVTRNVTFSDFLKSAPDLCAAPIPTPAVTAVAP